MTSCGDRNPDNTPPFFGYEHRGVTGSIALRRRRTPDYRAPWVDGCARKRNPGRCGLRSRGLLKIALHPTASLAAGVDKLRHNRGCKILSVARPLEQSLPDWTQYKPHASHLPEEVVKDGASHHRQTFHLAGRTDRPMVGLLHVGMRAIVPGVIGRSLVFSPDHLKGARNAARGGGRCSNLFASSRLIADEPESFDYGSHCHAK